MQPMTSAASTDTFVDMSTCVEPILAGVDVDGISGPVVIHLLMCVLSVESTLAGVDVYAVSGTVVIHVLKCVPVLNQHQLVLMLLVVQ